MKNPTGSIEPNEARDVEAWEIAQKIRIGNAIPLRDQGDLRSQLFLNYLRERDYFARQKNFAAAVSASMANDIRDAIKHRKTKQAQFENAMEPMTSVDPETGKTVVADAEDEAATIERFFGGLDRESRRTRFLAWCAAFRKKCDELSPEMREFLALIEKGTSHSEISVAITISRKSCFNRREKLRQIFGCLLREHRNIKALEVK